ncbi:MAG: protein translocase subunit SecD [Clostridiales bacterium]|nr:protein translocase subunit SecD [Clostridiales bacterium]
MANKPRRNPRMDYSSVSKKEPKLKPGAKLWIRFSIAILIVTFFIVMILTGAPGLGVSKVSEIKTGIDIRGGVSATLYPDVENINEVTDDQLRTIKTILEQRIEAQGTFDYNMSPDYENKRLLLEIPYSGGDNTNPQKVIDDLGEMALLTFREVDLTDDGYIINEITGRIEYLPTDIIVVEGFDIDTASAVYIENKPTISVKFTKEGTEKFSEATRRLVGYPIAIFLDDQYISAPTVESWIKTGDAIISGNFSADEAIDIANKLQYGALPFAMTAKEINSITPTLGESALSVTLDAAILALILVVAFMLFRYRLPGAVASVGLIGLVASIIFWISAFNASITLPGIAGIILTIGMGVDANVIIYERVKEELRRGIELQEAIDIGFKRAFSTILDANVTTLITGGALYIVGSGPIKGFALTLIIGIIMSFFTAIVIVKWLLKALASTKALSNRWLYGVKKEVSK